MSGTETKQCWNGWMDPNAVAGDRFKLPGLGRDGTEDRTPNPIQTSTFY